MILDRYTYRWGFVFRIKPEQLKSKSEKFNLKNLTIFYDKSFIEQLKIQTGFVESLK